MSESLRANDHIKQIVNQYADMLLRIAFTHVANQYDAEDMVQSVFLKYIEKQPSFESNEHEKAWFIRVLINMCHNHFHSSWFKKTVELDDNIGLPVFDENEMDDKAILIAVLRLPAKYRLAIYFFYYEDYSIAQIAKACNKKESTIRSQLFRARQLLKDSLKGAFIDE